MYCIVIRVCIHIQYLIYTVVKMTYYVISVQTLGIVYVTIEEEPSCAVCVAPMYEPLVTSAEQFETWGENPVCF